MNTGTIEEMPSPNFCHIRAEDGQKFWAHQTDFVNPSEMEIGRAVMFRVKLAQPKGKKYPGVTDVQAA